MALAVISSSPARAVEFRWADLFRWAISMHAYPLPRGPALASRYSSPAMPRTMLVCFGHKRNRPPTVRARPVSLGYPAISSPAARTQSAMSLSDGWKFNDGLRLRNRKRGGAVELKRRH
jgi:hypothetical protein